MMSRHILIISNPQDSHTRYLAQKITSRSHKVILLFPEMFGQHQFLSVDNLADEQILQSVISLGPNSCKLDEVYSVWYRRPRHIPPSITELETTTAEGMEFAREQWEAFTQGTYSIMNNCLWVSRPENITRASRKLLQLSMANQIGFNVPKTLITNDVVQVKAFFEHFNGNVIIKPIGTSWFYTTDGELKRVFTNRLSVEDLERSEEIKSAPTIFQEEIKKLYELRVNVVGQTILTIKIDSQRSSISQLDWRNYDFSQTPYTPYELPQELQEHCFELVRRLGLQFGAIDIIRDHQGQYVFLEINANGQFLWAEKLSGVAIGDALVDLLCGISLPL